MSRWDRIKRVTGGRRRRRAGGAGDADVALATSDRTTDGAIGGAMEGTTDDPVVGERATRPEGTPTGDEEAVKAATDAVAEDALLDELSVVFADGEQAPEPGRVDDPPVSDPPVTPDPAVSPVGTDPVEQSPADPGSIDVGRNASAATERPVLIDPGLVPTSPASAPDTADESGGEGGGEGPAGHTIQIGDQDLPEIRYLDEELGSTSGEGGPVVIDDDDTADAVVAVDATGGSVDGRMRQRRIRVRRAESRRRLQWLLIGAGVIVAAIAILAVLASSLFSVNQITVVGNRYTDPDALKEVIVGLDGTPVLLVDTASVEDELEAIPWVEDARVRTSFPNSASIEIRERVAVTAMPGADGLTRVLDKEGRVLDLIEGQPIALVWISGPITLDIPAGHFAPPGPAWASELVPKFTPSIRPRVESMQVTPDSSDLRLYLRPLSPAAADESDEGAVSAGQPALLEGPLIEVRFGSAIGDNEQIEKLVRLERVLEDIGTKRVAVIDVSTAEVTVL